MFQISAVDCPSDGDCAHNDTAAVHISITDVNDNTPVFDKGKLLKSKELLVTENDKNSIYLPDLYNQVSLNSSLS